MGLDTTPNCWHGSYISFGRWRQAIAKAAGYPELLTMQGFGGDISWDAYQDNPLTLLLDHDDSEGTLLVRDCAAIADRLEQLLPKLTDDGALRLYSDRAATEQFIAGLREAARLGEDVEFH